MENRISVASDLDLAYAAGAIDADGHITIKRSTDRSRNRKDCRNASYSPRLGLGQVTEAVPIFLRSLFGGSVYVSKPGTKNSRPMFKWHASDRSAARAAALMHPFLKIKAMQAKTVIELYDFKNIPKVRTVAYWYAKGHPEWTSESLLTSEEAAFILGLKATSLVSQSIRNGTLLSAVAPRKRDSKTRHVPEGLVIELLASRRGGNRHISAPRYIAALEEMYDQVQVLNRPGVNGTPASRREGCFARIA